MSLTERPSAVPGGDDASPAAGRDACGDQDRERSIPLRVTDLNALLLTTSDLSPMEMNQWERFSSLISATFHHRFKACLNELKDRYAPIDPDCDCIRIKGLSVAAADDSDEAFLGPFEEVLMRANYRRLDIALLLEAISAPNEAGLNFVPDLDLFEHLRVYVRGEAVLRRTTRTWRSKFLKRTVELAGYKRLVVALKFRPGKHLGDYARADVIYLRLFKDVPHVDMEMHLPEQGTKVRMRLIDKAQIASPIVTSLPVIAAKVFLGLVSPLAYGVLLAPISAGVNSFFGFQRAKQRHMHRMIRHLYYLNLANNGSVITRLIDAAEDEEVKEALLAYFILWRECPGGECWTQGRVDSRVEGLLKDRAGVTINFDIGDALQKLELLGLVRRDGQGDYEPLPIEEAIAVLDRHWDDQFRPNSFCFTKIEESAEPGLQPEEFPSTIEM